MWVWRLELSIIKAMTIDELPSCQRKEHRMRKVEGWGTFAFRGESAGNSGRKEESVKLRECWYPRSHGNSRTVSPS